MSTAVLLADRFLHARGGWFDLATGEPVHVRVTPAGPLREQIAWADRCAMLGALRHPALNPLLDYGAADRATLFEAFAARPPLTATRRGAARLVRHAARFLSAHGVPFGGEGARPLLRAVRHAAVCRGNRAVGVVLQPREVVHALRESLVEAAVRGTTELSVVGPAGSGLRTLRLGLARLAREEGYVPICPAALSRWPAVRDLVLARHVCLVTSAGEEAVFARERARFLSDLATRSTRSHVCLTFRETPPAAAPAFSLAPMGMTTMVSMVYQDPEHGPSLEEMFAAARRAEGLPGRFLDALGAREDDLRGQGGVVHETRAAYGGAPVRHAGVPPERAAPAARIASAIARAPARAASLEARGRHAAAARVLARAARVLEGRGEPEAAGRCWIQLAWLERNRGAIADACAHAERARTADAGSETHVAAGHVTAVCWTDAGRLIQAEATLRTLALAAGALPDRRTAARCTLSLARTLCWDGRSVEALAVLQPLRNAGDPHVECEAAIGSARAHLLNGDLPAAIGAAAEGLRRAAGLHDRRLAALAHRSMGEAMLTAGDLDAVRRHALAGIAAARAARLPLAVLRLRGMLLRGIAERDPECEEAVRLRAAIGRALRHDLPALLRRRLEAACRPPAAAYGIEPRETETGSAAVEAFLDAAQRAEDDGGALHAVLEALRGRLAAVSAVCIARDGRTLAAAGRPWREKSPVVAETLASGEPAATEGWQPLECAEPLRCGAQLLGAIGCRWTAGTAPLPRLRAATLRAAAMVLGTHVRGLLESVPPETPPAVCGDLLGDSPAAASVREAVHRASRAPFNVLIEGESGVGKELVARAIHRLSPRHTRRFCAVNCAALTDELVEAELFGHARGAFTGALTERAGLFEEADGGTLFLDEIAELSPRAQAKLLRVLQEGEVRRIGENLPRRIDVRIVAATNRPLEGEAAAGRFRADLRFRLDVLRIPVPPLRDRVADIPLLAQHFWAQAAARVGTRATLGQDALAALSRYDWPGNVRELQNAIAALAVHAPRRGRVDARLLPARLAFGASATGSFEAAREEFERRYVRAALAQAGGQRLQAARALGVSRQGLAKMLRRLGIEQNGAK